MVNINRLKFNCVCLSVHAAGIVVGPDEVNINPLCYVVIIHAATFCLLPYRFSATEMSSVLSCQQIL